MPEMSVDVDFEVICDTCGNGLCNKTDVRISRNRQMNQVMVQVCDECIDKKNEEIHFLKDEIESLEETIRELEEKI